MAGSPNKDGRKWLTLKNVGRILVARIAWTLYYRKDPGERQVDHKDTNPANDKIRNLRLASHNENQHNKKLNRNNVSGFKGVSFDKRRGVFVAFLKLDRKNIYCGSFATAEEANVHLTKVRKSMHKKFANQGQTGVTLPRT